MSSIELSNGQEIRCIVASMTFGFKGVNGFFDCESQFIVDKKYLPDLNVVITNNIECLNISENGLPNNIIEGLFRIIDVEFEQFSYKFSIVSNNCRIAKEKSKLSIITRKINKIKQHIGGI